MTTNIMEAALTVHKDATSRMGADRVRLLSAIYDTGSISGAARAIGLSYKAAWDAVNVMNNLFGQPLVDAAPGGRTGGKTTLTPAGHQVIAAFSLVQEELSRLMAGLAERLGSPNSPAPSSILWSLLMKTSARNTFRCTVSKIIEGPVSAEVLMSLTGDQHLSAIVTDRSVHDLGLVPGKEVFALIKSTFVLMAPEGGLKTSARNRLCGTVAAREDGAVNSEITLDLGGGKTIAAIITLESAKELGLQPGDRACALVKASHVLLAVE